MTQAWHRLRLWLGGAVLTVAAAIALRFGVQREQGPPPLPTDRPAAARPNVLLISLDTLRPDHLGCYGYTKGTSPNLDRFAADCVLFTNCRAQAPWTLPSHLSLFTSLLPTHHGVDTINKVLPPHIPTLAQLLRREGYHTAALVNNGQMRAHWGLARGFDSWREFEVDTPAGNCENITTEALAWFAGRPADRPFFLFLHYYDVHDPYAAPEPYRRRLGATLGGRQAQELCFRHRCPAQKFRNPEVLTDLITAYDAEIAWLDHELGRLLQAVPVDTLVVVCSDHGEAFKEHGWLLHGATLYDEEVRTPLLVRLPGGRASRCDAPVMLLDVAPTVLRLCGAGVPAAFEGADLSPLWQGGRLEERLILSETKAVLEGRYQLSATAYPLKGIYSLFDGALEVYRLPDEQKALSAADPAAELLRKPLRDWMRGEQYWMIHAAGRGDFEATIEVAQGGFGLFIPVGLDPTRDDLEAAAEGRVLRWHVYPDGGVKSLFLQPAWPDAALRVDFKVNGAAANKSVFVGKDRRHPEALPATVGADVPPLDPFQDRPFAADGEGFYVCRHRSPGGQARPASVRQLDPETLRQLRSLGYLR